MTMNVLVNPGGGSAADDPLAPVRDALAGQDASVELVEGPDLVDRVAQLIAKGATCIVAAGGDGTISAVAGALAGTDVALGILPLGTLNHLARDLGIPFDLEEAASILQSGERRLIDLAEVNDRLFVNNSAIGLYPLMVIDREAQQHRLGRSKRLAMIVAGVRTLVRFRHYRLSLRINGTETEQEETPLLFVGNNDYRLDIAAAGCRDRLDDGRLSVFVMRKKSRLGMFTAMIRALFNRARDDDMIRLDDVTTLEVQSRRTPLTISSDGETLQLATPLIYRIRPKALTVIAPRA